MHGYTSATNATLRNSPATFDQPFAANSWNQLIFKLDSSFQSARFRFSFWFICKYEYRVTLSPNELKINSKLGGKYVGQECGELCNPLLVRRKLLGKSCRDGCNIYIYFFYALQFFTSTFINSKRDKNSYNSLWMILTARLNGYLNYFSIICNSWKLGRISCDESNSLFTKYKNREYWYLASI